MIRFALNALVWLFAKERVNIIKTLYFNFMTMPFSQAIRLPVLIYGPCKLYLLRGKVECMGGVRRGMLKIGLMDPMRSYHDKSFVWLDGTLTIGNHVVLRRGIRLQVLPSAHVRLDDDVYVGDNNTIISRRAITIHAATRVGNNTTFMDTDIHYTINTATRIVRPNTADIEIGENNWIGGWCTIKKGTKTSRGTVIAGPYSMISKDYSTLPPFSILGGSPVKVLGEGIRRVNNNDYEIMLMRHFAQSDEPYHLPEGTDIEAFCMP